MKIKRLPNREELKTISDTGWRIKKVRKECGLSQQELAEIIGKKSAVAISLYENMKRFPNCVDLQKIAYACNVPTSELI